VGKYLNLLGTVTIKSYKFEEFSAVIERNITEGIYKPGQKLPSVRLIMEQEKL